MLVMFLGPLTPSLNLIHSELILQTGSAMALGLFIRISPSPVLGMVSMALAGGSPAWGPAPPAWWHLPLVLGLTSALGLTKTLHSSTFSPPWGSSQRWDIGMYFALVSGWGLRSPMWPYMLLQVFFDLINDMLHSIRLESTLTNRDTPFADTLHKEQDEHLVRGTSQLLKGSVLPSLWGCSGLGRQSSILLAMCALMLSLLNTHILHRAGHFARMYSWCMLGSCQWSLSCRNSLACTHISVSQMDFSILLACTFTSMAIAT